MIKNHVSRGAIYFANGLPEAKKHNHQRKWWQVRELTREYDVEVGGQEQGEVSRSL